MKRCRTTLAGLVFFSVAGCQGEPMPPRDGTPVVAPDSSAYQQALAETTRKINQDKAAEAKARARLRSPVVVD